jgi:hypothetical protein
MKLLRSVTVGLALACGASAAFAQTIISRQIADEPVETTVVRDAYGNVTVTRRALGPDALPAPHVAPVAPIYEGRIVHTYPEEDLDSYVVRQRGYVAPRPPIVAETERPVRRVERRPPATVVLSAPQRRMVYETVQEQVVTLPSARHRTPPIVARGGDIDDEFDDTVTYRVGTRLPPGSATYGLPPHAVAQVPAVRPYNYAVIAGRTYLIEPGTGVVVADITP